MPHAERIFLIIRQLYVRCDSPEDFTEACRKFVFEAKKWFRFDSFSRWFANRIVTDYAERLRAAHGDKRLGDAKIDSYVTNAIERMHQGNSHEIAPDTFFSLAVLMTMVSRKHQRGEVNGLEHAAEEFLDAASCHVVKRVFRGVEFYKDR